MTKTISLSEEAYRALAAHKREGESFSDVALRLSRTLQQERLLEFAGAWDMTDEEADALIEQIYRWRDESLRPPVDLS